MEHDFDEQMNIFLGLLINRIISLKLVIVIFLIQPLESASEVVEAELKGLQLCRTVSSTLFRQSTFWELTLASNCGIVNSRIANSRIEIPEPMLCSKLDPTSDGIGYSEISYLKSSKNISNQKLFYILSIN
jgi:hypothetical protein